MKTTRTAALTLSSPAFPPGGEIPTPYTCDGIDHSPALAWSGAPEGTRSFALIVDDPDAPDPQAPKIVWVHWVLYDIPATTTSIAEGSKADRLTRGTKVGLNDWRKAGWGGPCPPVGRHRYFFKLYALDVAELELEKADKQAVERAMDGHVLAQTELIGTYRRGR